jgi:hypothetical protein
MSAALQVAGKLSVILVTRYSSEQEKGRAHIVLERRMTSGGLTDISPERMNPRDLISR